MNMGAPNGIYGKVHRLHAGAFQLLNVEHKGDASFEFIIIMTLFALIIFGVASSPLMDTIKSKINVVTDYITNNNNPENHV